MKDFSFLGLPAGKFLKFISCFVIFLEKELAKGRRSPTYSVPTRMHSSIVPIRATAAHMSGT